MSVTSARVPQRIQRHRNKGWRMPEDAVYVGRPTRWGNPFRLRTPSGLARVPGANDPTATWEYEGRVSADGASHDYFHPDGRVTRHTVRYMTAEECVQTYRAALLGNDTPAMRMAFPGGLGKWLSFPDPTQPYGRGYVTPAMVRDLLAGRDLVCWCPASQACHADVLLAVANDV